MGRLGSSSGTRASRVFGELAAMLELPGPEGQHLHECPPRDLIVVNVGDAPPPGSG